MNHEVAYARRLIENIVASCPRRVAGSDDERRAHEMIRHELAAIGLRTEVRPVRWNRSIYENLAMHFGLGSLGSLVAGRAPAVGLAMHAIAAASYFADSTRAAFPLRTLLPAIASQNVVATLPAKAPLRLRVVLLAHADAAYTGLVFQPAFVARFGSKPGTPMHKALRVATLSLGGLALLDVWQLLRGRSITLRVARALLTLPPLMAFALNADVVMRDHVVPGAMDDLSGVAGMILLAKRLSAGLPEDVELVCVATGCEEAGLGGAQALADEMASVWDRHETVVIGLDGLANGTLRFFDEGEIVPSRRAPWLRRLIQRIAGEDPRFSEVDAYDIPVGGTDAQPFAQHGFDALTLGCVDPSGAMPRHYHLPTDTPENLEAAKIPFCVDFAEKLVSAIVAMRTSHRASEAVSS